MGAILSAALFVCLSHRFRICLCEERVANTNTCAHSNQVDFDERPAQEIQPGNYWTIVSNTKGDMCTAIETEFERNTEPLPTGQIMSTLNNESKQSSCIVNVNENLDEYLNPIHSRSVELEYYIHPIHTSHVNPVIQTKRHSSEF
ncbi:hypothetical protein ACJMK2_025726 [Sinanodonta woodiana]|uniref:Uncharacterized protein n=1 Tax=Sinanodonta woodiana TaxID=1069815 RepID=A0ABD3XHE8_SINWO